MVPGLLELLMALPWADKVAFSKDLKAIWDLPETND